MKYLEEDSTVQSKFLKKNTVLHTCPLFEASSTFHSPRDKAELVGAGDDLRHQHTGSEDLGQGDRSLLKRYS